ncbi:hypothetical protein GQ55_2G410900 [Panicum hallii var. hallii]|uniref:Uncharacterized protein n=1 Tax=Panicum hallii var. hallii TaxID=1504633 RepID=A0A2T7EXR6_9POAL|nr:hypothetical protein GQ55_2G410900 [Panicum hallii var. hallii]
MNYMIKVKMHIRIYMHAAMLMRRSSAHAINIDFYPLYIICCRCIYQTKITGSYIL